MFEAAGGLISCPAQVVVAAPLVVVGVPDAEVDVISALDTKRVEEEVVTGRLVEQFFWIRLY
jgi:hypothetical protein